MTTMTPPCLRAAPRVEPQLVTWTVGGQSGESFTRHITKGFESVHLSASHVSLMHIMKVVSQGEAGGGGGEVRMQWMG